MLVQDNRYVTEEFGNLYPKYSGPSWKSQHEKENISKKASFLSGQMKDLYSSLLKTAIFILHRVYFKEEKAQLCARSWKWFQVQRALKIYITQLLIYFL